MFSGGLQENLAHLLASIHLSVLQVTSSEHIQHPHVNNELYEYFVERSVIMVTIVIGIHEVEQVCSYKITKFYYELLLNIILYNSVQAYK